MTAHHAIRLQFADEVTRECEAAPGQTVLDAALLAGLPLLHQCRSGSCGSCAATLLAGEVDIRTTQGSTLLPAERAQGVRLLCQTEARSGCSFSLAYASTVGEADVQHAFAFVNAVEPQARDVLRVSLELADDHWIDFRPGQYVQIKVPGTETWRSYSPASHAASLPRVDFLIKLIAGGVMSDWLAQTCRADDVLELAGPFGHFFLREAPRAPHVFLAGGTGLAPMLSMLEALRRRGGKRPPMLLCFGCRTEDELFCMEELTLYEQWLPGLEIRVAVERSTSGRRRLGTPLSVLAPADFAHPETVTYVCGPPPMVDAASSLLAGWGISPARIHSEQFAASAAYT